MTTDGESPASGSPSDPHDRAREGLEHLQAAARELIQAARAMLDVAEGLVDDPEAVAQVVGTVGAFGELVRNVAGAGPRPRRAGGGNGADGAHGADHSGNGDGAAPAAAPRTDLQRITVL